MDDQKINLQSRIEQAKKDHIDYLWRMYYINLNNASSYRMRALKWKIETNNLTPYRERRQHCFYTDSARLYLKRAKKFRARAQAGEKQTVDEFFAK